MIKICIHIILFLAFSVQASAMAVSEDIPAHQVDSILKAISAKVYENPDKSIELGLSVYENENHSLRSRTKALMLVVLAHTSKRNYQKALEYNDLANELSKELNDELLQIEILSRTGILYQQLKIFDKSIEYLEKAEQKALKYPVRDSVSLDLANGYTIRGFIYKDNLNCDIALEFFNKGIEEYKKLEQRNAKTNLSIVYYNKGNCYISRSEFDKAKKSFNESLEYAKRQNASSLVSFAEKGMAEVYNLEGKHEDAIVLLKSALSKSKNVGDIILNLGVYKGLFENSLALNQWDEYEKYYKLFLETQLEIKISERNSVSDSIKENSKLLDEDLDKIQTKFKNNFSLIIVLILCCVIIVLLLEIKNKKTTKALQKKIDDLQNIYPKTNAG